MKTVAGLFGHKNFLLFFIGRSVSLFNLVFCLSAAVLSISAYLHFASFARQLAALLLLVFCFALPVLLLTAWFCAWGQGIGAVRAFKYFKGAELAVLSLFLLSLHFGNIYFLCFCTLLLGVLAAALSALQNPVLNRITYEQDLLPSVSFITAAGFIAFPAAVSAAYVFPAAMHFNFMHPGFAVVLVSLLSFAASLFIDSKNAEPKAVPLLKDILPAARNCMVKVYENRKVFLTFLASSWFYCMFLCLLSICYFTGRIMNGEPALFGFLLIESCFAAIAGALLPPFIFNNKARIKHAVISLCIASASFVVLACLFGCMAPVSESGSLAVFLNTPYGKQTASFLFIAAFFLGVYAVSVRTLLHQFIVPPLEAELFGAGGILGVASVFVFAAVSGWLASMGFGFTAVILLAATVSFTALIYLVRMLPGDVFKIFVRSILSAVYHVEVKGEENFKNLNDKTLIIANHTSFVDVPVLWAYTPFKVSFAIDTYVAKKLWIKPFLYFIKHFPIDHTNPIGVKTIIDEIDKGAKVIIFPEGRITTTGSFMKIYPGPAMVADKSGADILPVCIEGGQYSMFSYFGNKIDKRPRSKITVHVLPARKLDVPKGLKSKQRRSDAARRLYDIMCEMKFTSIYKNQTLFNSLMGACRLVGRDKVIIEDASRRPVTFGDFIKACLAQSLALCKHTLERERVGFMLSNSVVSAQIFFALSASGRVPCLLDYSMDAESLIVCCKSAKITTIITSRGFIARGLERVKDTLEHKGINIIYSEDVLASVTPFMRFRAFMSSHFTFLRNRCLRTKATADSPAVAMFNLDALGMPKGALLSHKNIQANKAQLLTVLDLGLLDIAFIPMPLYSALGFTGFILALTNGIKTVLYPSPSDARAITELIYASNATVLFSAGAYLDSYAQSAHPYDFYALRFAVAGNGLLEDSTIKAWSETFNVRLLNCYGLSEAFSVLTTNTAMYFKKGSRGRFLPSVRYKIDPSSKQGEGRLYVKGQEDHT